MESSVFIDLIVWGDQWGGGGGVKKFAVRLVGFIRVSKP